MIAAANNDALAAFNGSVLILAAYCLLFLIIHLWATAHRRRLTLRRWFFRLPIGMQVAVGTAAICAGEVGTRLALWIWHFVFSGRPEVLHTYGGMLGIGAAVLAIGFLCILRVVSRPFGRWPVTAAVVTVLVYLATFL